MVCTRLINKSCSFRILWISFAIMTVWLNLLGFSSDKNVQFQMFFAAVLTLAPPPSALSDTCHRFPNSNKILGSIPQADEQWATFRTAFNARVLQPRIEYHRVKQTVSRHALGGLSAERGWFSRRTTLCLLFQHRNSLLQWSITYCCTGRLSSA